MSESAVQRFLRRSTVTTAAVTGFAALAWADATGFAGAAPGWWLMPLAVVVAVAGVGELAGLFHASGLPVSHGLLRASAVAIVVAAGLAGPAAAARPAAALAWPTVAFMLAVVMFLVREIVTYPGDGRSVERIAASVLAVAYVGLGMAFVVAMRFVHADPPSVEATGRGQFAIVPLASLVAAVKGGDVAAYVVGSLFGRHRMCPAVSPAKTWEGAVASVAASIVAAVVVIDWNTAHDILPRPLGAAVGYGAAVGMMGVVGDLAESLLKRGLGAKDSGRSLSALGGVLDLADSLLLAAPVAWILWVIRLPTPG